MNNSNKRSERERDRERKREEEEKTERASDKRPKNEDWEQEVSATDSTEPCTAVDTIVCASVIADGTGTSLKMTGGIQHMHHSWKITYKARHDS